MGAERIFERFEQSSLQIEVPEILTHKVHQPDVVVHFFDADGLSGKDLAEVDFFLAQTDATTARDHDGLVVERIVEAGHRLLVPAQNVPRNTASWLRLCGVVDLDRPAGP